MTARQVVNDPQLNVKTWLIECQSVKFGVSKIDYIFYVSIIAKICELIKVI